MICIVFQKVSSRLGIPALLAFIVLGMLLGSDGLLKIPFDDYGFAEKICSVALIFIMFYGGFGMRWQEAKKIAVKATLLLLRWRCVNRVLHWTVLLFCSEDGILGRDSGRVCSQLHRRSLCLFYPAL